MTEISVLELKPIIISIDGIKLMKEREMEAKKVVQRTEIVKILVCGYHGKTWNQIDNSSRKGELVKVRHLLAYFFKDKLNFGPSEIGRMFTEKKDHSTILHSIQTVKDLRDSDVKYRNDFRKLEQLIDYELNK